MRLVLQHRDRASSSSSTAGSEAAGVMGATDNAAHTLVETYSIAPALKVEEHFFKCPVSYVEPDGPQLTVFVRVCSGLGQLGSSQAQAAGTSKRPLILFLQGGPGFECSSSAPAYAGVLKVLIDRGYTVCYLDQRGTGLSTCLTIDRLRAMPKLQDQVAYCTHFRADSIVRDCEMIRKVLTADRQTKRWSLLGQSFGGFCELTYLSLFPESLEAVINTGGMAPIFDDSPLPVYERLIHKVRQVNLEYFVKFPSDVSRVKTILNHLDRQRVETPNGGVLTRNRFRQLGLDLGMHGGAQRLHNLIFRCHTDLTQSNVLGYRTLEFIEHAASYDSVPIYSILHECIYAQSSSPTNWAASKIVETLDAEGHNHYFLGEQILPGMFDAYAGLRPFKEIAHALADYDAWTPLYNIQQLRQNRVPVVASIYIDDLFVHIDAALATCKALGNCRELITNRWLHNALRHEPQELLGYLFELLQECIPIGL